MLVYRTDKMMFRSYLEKVVLICLNKIKGERTSYSIFHILKGKKSSQTIQDGYLFGISNFFATYPDISREDFQNIIRFFHENKWITLVDDSDEYTVTVLGIEVSRNLEIEKSLISHINGHQFHQVAPLYWKRFSLLFQVISNSVHQNKKYYGVQRDVTVQNWVKNYLFKQQKSLKNVSFSIYDEMQKILIQLPGNQADIFLMKLSGFHRIGYSNQQIAEIIGVDETFVHYQFLNALHFIIDEVASQSDKYPYLNGVYSLGKAEDQLPLTKSSVTTFRYLQQGLSVEEISSIRNLKRNTIEDHIIELAFQGKDLNIEQFISNEAMMEIMDVIETLQTKQLKMIKQALPSDISYFQIRLALARRRDF